MRLLSSQKTQKANARTAFRYYLPNKTESKKLLLAILKKEHFHCFDDWKSASKGAPKVVHFTNKSAHLLTIYRTKKGYLEVTIVIALLNEVSVFTKAQEGS